MFKPTWTVDEYVIPASHPRGYRRGVRDPQKSRLCLHVKKYTPQRDKPLEDDETAVTLILQHGMPPGDNKECLEPFMWDLLNETDMPPVRAVWAADIASSGQSFWLNRADIGDEPHWFDSARDMMQLVNHFQDEMRPPLIGYGHSWGANAVIMCASWHPRIFQGIILSEPVIENGWFHQNDPKRLSGQIQGSVAGLALGPGLAKRRTKWSSRAEAEAYIKRSRTYQDFDARVLQQLLRYDLRDTEDGGVQFMTPASQAVAFFMRPSPTLPGFPEGEEYASRTPDSDSRPGFYNAMAARVKEALPGIHCKVLFQWAKGDLFISDEAYRERLVPITGSGVGGGGGKAKGQIEEVFVEGGHSLPFFRPTESARMVSHWLGGTFWRWWLAEEAARQREAPIDPINFPPGLIERLDESMISMKPKHKI